MRLLSTHLTATIPSGAAHTVTLGPIFTSVPRGARRKHNPCMRWCWNGNECGLGAGHTGHCVCGEYGCDCKDR